MGRVVQHTAPGFRNREERLGLLQSPLVLISPAPQVIRL
jgi:hypothetical protein